LNLQGALCYCTGIIGNMKGQKSISSGILYTLPDFWA